MLLIILSSASTSSTSSLVTVSPTKLSAIEAPISRGLILDFASASLSEGINRNTTSVIKNISSRCLSKNVITFFCAFL